MKKGLYLGVVSTFIVVLLLTPGCKNKNHALGPTQAKASQSSDQTAKKKVLIVHSYHREHEWCAGITRGIRMVMNDSQYNIEEFYMDTKRKTSEQYMQQIGQSALDLIQQWDADLVILADDNAQKYVGSKLAGRKKPYVIFCGVNQEPQDYGYPACNVTGILERPLFSQSLLFLKDLVPGIQKMAILSDTGLTTDGAYRYMQTQPTHGIEIVRWSKIRTFDEWKQTVLELQGQVDVIAVYTYHTLKSGDLNSDSVPSKEVMAWTCEHCKVPISCFFVYAIDDGAVCGVLEPGADQGRTAAELALKIFAGTPVSDIPLQISQKGQKMINMKAADRLGMNIPDTLFQQTDVVVITAP